MIIFGIFFVSMVNIGMGHAVFDSTFFLIFQFALLHFALIPTQNIITQNVKTGVYYTVHNLCYYISHCYNNYSPYVQQMIMWNIFHLKK